MSTLKKRILLGIIALFLFIQLFRIDKTNPEVDPTKDLINLTTPPAEVAQLLKTVCYDCHAHETKYPWYTNIAPVSWWIKNHINHGRGHLNFSLWADYEVKKRNHKLEECYEEVEEAHMPLSSYTWMHPEARLSEDQRATLVNWFKQKYQESQ